MFNKIPGLLFGDAGIVDDQRGMIFGKIFFTAIGHGGDKDPGGSEPGDHFRIFQIGLELEENVAAGLIFFDVDSGVQRGVRDHVYQHIAGRGAPAFHAVDVSLQISAFNKIGQGILFKTGHCTGIKIQGGNILIHKRLRQYHIADAHGGGYAFGEGVHVDDFVPDVDAVKRGSRHTAVAVFAVVIVLNDITSGCGVHPLQQLQSACDRCDEAQRKVVRRGDMYDVCGRTV